MIIVKIPRLNDSNPISLPLMAIPIFWVCVITCQGIDGEQQHAEDRRVYSSIAKQHL